MNEIPEFLPHELYDKGTTAYQDIAALAIAKLFDPYLEKCNVHFQSDKQGDKTLVGVMCTGGIILSGCQLYAATQLLPWLCSTTLLLDIALYPFEGKQIQDVNPVKVIQDVQCTQVPVFLAEYYSISILKTARQLAIKLIALLQLYRLCGSKQTEVSGLALPAMKKDSVDEVEDEVNESIDEMAGHIHFDSDESVSQGSSFAPKQVTKPDTLQRKCKIAPKKIAN